MIAPRTMGAPPMAWICAPTGLYVTQSDSGQVWGFAIKGVEPSDAKPVRTFERPTH
ncbi:hypothetical protein I3J27_34815 [Bradyrhizobium xenonodulans]|uniref:Uncharacterized protein n=1 Tax=Bradyrhizobium xenonodulans TaxID=2736875 RepID=A0ABY7MKD7_9BRAD|nr:hypothetical protein [Bradyrhizobium xenonodulans]WBL78071.1 hypothetical protein I3J27_34815 [Bradyrhizobium xenonodulans]